VCVAGTALNDLWYLNFTTQSWTMLQPNSASPAYDYIYGHTASVRDQATYLPTTLGMTLVG
jgi:hypothetical protein